MKNQHKKTTSLTILFLLSLLNIFGQTEFLVSINTNNGVFTKIDSLPNVKFITVGPSCTTFDENNHNFIFKGSDNKGNSYLYAVDARTGNVISNPIFPVKSDPYDIIEELHYGNSSNTLYALYWDNPQSKEYLISINANTGSFSKINSIPDVKSVISNRNSTAFDEKNYLSIFRGKDNAGNSRLYTIDVLTGKVISNPIFPIVSDPFDDVLEFHYDNSSTTLYGLYSDYPSKRIYLVSINPNSGAFNIIDSLSGAKFNLSLGHYTTFDKINHRYIFRGLDNQGKTRLYSVDVNTGKIISNPLFPVLTDPADNVIELQFDNSSGILYALHWDANTITGISDNEVGNPIILEQNAPNPFAEQTTINYFLPDNTAKAQMLFYNAQGKLIQSTELTQKGKGQLNVFASDLSSGIYTYTLVVDGKIIETKQMIKAK